MKPTASARCSTSSPSASCSSLPRLVRPARAMATHERVLRVAQHPEVLGARRERRLVVGVGVRRLVVQDAPHGRAALASHRLDVRARHRRLRLLQRHLLRLILRLQHLPHDVTPLLVVGHEEVFHVFLVLLAAPAARLLGIPAWERDCCCSQDEGSGLRASLCVDPSRHETCASRRVSGSVGGSSPCRVSRPRN
eukprot:2072131-Prymnesium_polylepis.1